jgi:hypothetical protein
MVASFGLAVGLVLIGLGVMSSVSGREALGLPDEIERTDPIRNAERVLRQTQVFVDLAEGHTGVLIIDGLELPTIDVGALADQAAEDGKQVDNPEITGVRFDRGNATLTFLPGDATPIPEFSEGRHLVTVVYWKVTESRDRSRSYTWEFNVF